MKEQKMNDFVQSINTLVQQNQILSTVAGGSVIVWVVSHIKSIFTSIVNAVKALISFQIVNVYEDNRGGNGRLLSPAQLGFNMFLSKCKNIWERTRSLDLNDRQAQAYDDYDFPVKSSADAGCSETYGFSIKLMFGKIVLCSRSINTQQKITVSTCLTVFFASKRRFMEKLNAAIAAEAQRMMKSSLEKRDHINVYMSNAMFTSSVKFKRSASTVFTNDDAHASLLDSVKTFLASKQMYKDMAYPYSFSALLYGEPGCGKTSTILAIASELNYDIVYVNPSKVNVVSLMNAMQTYVGRAVFVFEDIDAVDTMISTNRNDESNDEPDVLIKEGMSLSDILNITDGLLGSDGSIMLFTTNHIEKLDPAFLRKGRMNKTVEFTYLNSKTAAKMVKYHLGVDVDGLADEVKPTELQDMIMDVKTGHATIEDLKQKFAA